MSDLKTKLTLSGWFLLIAGLICLPAGLILLSPALTQGGLFVLLLLAVAVPFARLNLSRVNCRLSAPETVYSKEEFEIEVRLHNAGRVLSAFDIEAHSSVLCAGPVHFARVQPGAEVCSIAVARFVRRGRHAQCDTILRSRFPWGLVCCEKTGVTPLPLVVSPQPRFVHDLKALLEQGVGFSGCRYTRVDDLLGRFSAVREFRPGDRIKLISWPFSARQGKLIVKEMEQPGLNQCKIVFHSYQPPRTVLTRKSFETSLSLLAGLFSFFHQNFIPFRFMDCLPVRHDIAVQPDESSLRHALACLASAEMTILSSMDSVFPVLEKAASYVGTLLVVSNAPLRLWEKQLPHSHEVRFCLDNHTVRIFRGSLA